MFAFLFTCCGLWDERPHLHFGEAKSLFKPEETRMLLVHTHPINLDSVGQTDTHTNKHQIKTVIK